ncbi:hypothetical protein QN277_016360 [Acacia crassicarpa]|uniref:CCHC-type domain-containing protein n=1 Tax=Acacia crassicarpa TaxID=499986 RepID=A0AAE1TC04_9FABA|nr:hypothetical protein QN277_016360 [Acacia crassicarpa]
MEEDRISSSLVWKEVKSERTLIGKVLTSRSYTRSTMESILRKAWNLQTGFDVIEVTGNAFLFKFEEEEEYCRILRDRPWSINGCLLNLLERSRYNSCEEFDFGYAPMWIQFHNVPLEALCLENAIRLGGEVSEVMLAEDPVYNGRYLRKFLCAKVILDLRKPLAYGFWLPRPDGRKIWISVRYEKLQNFYYNCGKLGHDNRICSSTRLMSSLNPSEPRFGAWLATTECRGWDETMVVIGSEGAEIKHVSRKKEEARLRRKLEEKLKASKVAEKNEDDLFSIKIIHTVCSAKEGGWERNGRESKSSDDTSQEADLDNLIPRRSGKTVDHAGEEQPDSLSIQEE